MSERNYVQVVGQIWIPATTAAMQYNLTKHDVEEIESYGDIRCSMRDPEEYIDEGITRKDIAQWVAAHTGDFQSVTDFHACIGNVDIDWLDLENAFLYNSYVYGDDDEE